MIAAYLAFVELVKGRYIGSRSTRVVGNIAAGSSNT